MLYDSWTPSKEEMESAEQVLIDQENHATVRFVNETGENVMVLFHFVDSQHTIYSEIKNVWYAIYVYFQVGVVDGRKLQNKDGIVSLSKAPNSNHSDYSN